MRQVLVLFVLVLLTQVVIRYGGELYATADSLTLLTTGFILVGAYTMGELFRRMVLRALLGYLAAGVLFGHKLIELVFGDPSVAPVGGDAIKELGLVNVLAVGGFSVAALSEAGAKRISVGSKLTTLAFGAVENAAREMLDKGTFEFAQWCTPYDRLQKMFGRP